MTTVTSYTTSQIAELTNLCAAMAAVPAEVRPSAVNEAAAYLKGYSAAMQTVTGHQATIPAPASA